MFEYLKKYDQILVTGPQRSGTTIASKMIAQDLGYRCFDETVLPESFDGFVQRILRNNLEGVKGVYQGPTRSFCCHMLPEEVAVVFMVRPVADIIVSQERINWVWEDQEIIKYPMEYRATPVSSMKYLYWNKVQKPLIKHAYDVTYSSLKNHSLWLDKQKRKNFNSKQTK